MTSPNIIIQGDCTTGMAELASGSVDFVLTDPPYIVDYRSRDGRANADLEGGWFLPVWDLGRSGGRGNAKADPQHCRTRPSRRSSIDTRPECVSRKPLIDRPKLARLPSHREHEPVLAMQFAFQVLDPTPVLSGFRGTHRTRFTETRDRVLLPGRQLCRIQTLLAAPAAPRRLIHPGCGDQRLQSSRRRPTLAASSPIARSIGQRVRTPTLQRRCTHSNLARYLLHRRTLRRQQSRHNPILVRLSVSSHFLMSAPSKVRSYPGDNFSDTEGGNAGGGHLRDDDGDHSLARAHRREQGSIRNSRCGY